MTNCCGMRPAHRFLVLALLCAAALLGGIASVHVHDSGTPGLYNAECPSCEFGRHTVGLALPSADAVSLDLTPVLLGAAGDEQATRDLSATATPRAPPRS
jgi:uncharacterized protein YceK